jgi:protease-4
MSDRRDFWAGVVLVLVLFGAFFAAVALLSSVSADAPRITRDVVAVVDIQGGIYAPQPVVRELEYLMQSDRVKAIVLRLDTPGGGVAASQEIFETVLKAKRQGKPLVASMGAVVASGGYYIASACDTIMALPATVTGSIGVIAMFPVLAGLYEKIGISYDIVKSGQFKDTGTSTRELTPAERAYLDSLIMDMFDQFIAVVSEHRDMPIDQVRDLADGRIFTGRQAVANGLVDTLGTFQDAVDLAGEIAGLGKDPEVYRKQRYGLWEAAFEGFAELVARGFENRVPAVSYQMSF